MRRNAPTPLPAIAVALGTLILSALLFAFSRAPESDARLAALEARLETVTKAARAPGDLNAFPAGSVCGGKLHEGFRDQLGVAIGGAGLEVERLELNLIGPSGGAPSLTVYEVQLKGSGAYEAAIMSLSALGKFRPTLFIDSLALRNRTSAVDLELKGRVFCR